MHKAESGFSHILIPLLVVGVVVVGSGYVVYHREHKTNPSPTSAVGANTTTTGSASTLATPPSASTAAGVAGNIDSLTASLTSSESALNTQYGTSDQTSDANLGTTATNVGGAYDASNY